MPNPFLRRQAATSTTDVDRPVAVTPVPENPAGPVFAYRGQEKHGVEPTVNYRDPEKYDGYERGVDLSVYEPEDPGPDPIPVRIVQDTGREVTKIVTFRAFA